jgi:hypothetical protein
MRIVEGRVEVTVRPGFAWVESGRVDLQDIPDLQAALTRAQEILWRQT